MDGRTEAFSTEVVKQAACVASRSVTNTESRFATKEILSSQTLESSRAPRRNYAKRG